MNRTTEKIPTWSLCYLINGDATALTDKEIRMVDEWVSKWQVEIVSPLMDEDLECPATIQLAHMEFLPESANLDLIGEFVLPHQWRCNGTDR